MVTTSEDYTLNFIKDQFMDTSSVQLMLSMHKNGKILATIRFSESKHILVVYVTKRLAELDEFQMKSENLLSKLQRNVLKPNDDDDDDTMIYWFYF